MKSIREMLEDLGIVRPDRPGKPGRNLDVERVSKYWIRRSGRRFRATKKYADNQQKPTKRIHHK